MQLDRVDKFLLQKLKEIWERFDLRAVIILSLSVQAFLIIFAPFRKRTFNTRLILLLWAAYLLADWVAKVGLGLITSNLSRGESGKTTVAKDYIINNDVAAFWAPFFLAHLGGPDTITAFSLGDNEFWNRQLIFLLFQFLVASYIFYETLPNNQLWFPTILMFIYGLIKCVERTMALYRASLDKLRDSIRRDPDPGPSYAKLMDERRSKKEANLPIDIHEIPMPPREDKAVNVVKEGKLTHEEVVLYAHHFFDTFKGLIVDLKFSFRERSQCRDFFLNRTAEDAFKVIEVELNFIHDILFTKANFVYNKKGYWLRVVSLALVVISFGVFYFEDKKYITTPADVVITYTLLLGAVALEALAFLRFVTSDWFRVGINTLPDVNLSDETPAETDHRKVPSYIRLCRQLGRYLCRRWCEHMLTYNLIFYCLHHRDRVKEKIVEFFGVTRFYNWITYVRHESFTEELRNHIFDELKKKSELAEDIDTAKQISAAKGDLVLRLEGCKPLLPYVVDAEYDQILLSWHIATELCYCEERGREDPSKADENKSRKISKHLSDYMLYLLVMQPTMMSPVADIAQIRFRDTCAEARKFLHGAAEYQREIQTKDYIKFIFRGLGRFLRDVLISMIQLLPSTLVHFISLFVSSVLALMQEIRGPDDRDPPRKIRGARMWLPGDKDEDKAMKSETKRLIDACQRILNVDAEVEPAKIKGDRSQSVLFEGCRLAKQLRNQKDKWEVISKVWVELLSHAAIHCRPLYYLQHLSRGGELVTIVWLLAAHLGFGYQFRPVGKKVKLVANK